jgi:two-component system sensor histidine kinase BaeS
MEIEITAKMGFIRIMEIKLSHKLFGAFFLILAIAVGTLLFSRYLFSLNFERYIHQVEVENLQQLVPALQKEYRAADGWERIRNNSDRWQYLLHSVPDIRGQIPPPPSDGDNAPGGPRPPDARAGSQPNAMPPPPPDGDNAPDGPRPPDARAGSQPNAMPSFDPPRILLMDADHQAIIGIPGPKDQHQLVAVEVDGRTVGWLGLRTHKPFISGPPAELLKRQARDLYMLGGVVIGLTALIAFIFSRHLLRPVQRLARGTMELTQRNFTARISPTTGDELGRLAENFNAMAATLEDYERMRRQWLTDISHELRTPLAVLRGEIEALQDGVRDPSPNNLTSLHTEILRINKLVEDLHLLSRADSDKLSMNKQLIAPCDILKATVESYRTRLSQCGITAEMKLSGLARVPIKGDADRLAQVFTNILENACRYVQSTGLIEVSGHVDAHELTIYFQDSGPGVPDDALPRLFDRLYRVDASRSRESGGSGLGLSICLQIIEGHSGRIWADKSTLGGLSIGITLPITAT